MTIRLLGPEVPKGEKLEDNRPLIMEVSKVTKRFGSVLANEDVSLRIREGEIHAVLGENGAGKSTLVKIIYGALAPDSGKILWKGAPVQIPSPAVARSLGIGMVFQHFSLFESMSVAENMLLALPDFKDISGISKQIEEKSAEYGLLVDPGATVADLSVGEKQRIEIVRCLLQNPAMIIMDEPTSVLTPQEAGQLGETLLRLSDEGCAILYISHRLEEVRNLCHGATILRHGKVVGNCVPKEETPARLAKLMVGEDIRELHFTPPSEQLSEKKLEIMDMSFPRRDEFSMPLIHINLDLHAGELVAVAGVAGNGQSELFDAISGEMTAKHNKSVAINGVCCGRMGISARRKLNAAFVPEERLGHAAVPVMRLSDNIVLTRHAVDRRVVKSKMISRKGAQAVGSSTVKRFDVRIGHDDPEASSLSGGNLQKFVVGRELIRNPEVLVVNQPTWGVDVGAASVIRTALVNLARSGSAVLILSQDLDEIFEIADRIAVISHGRLSEAYTKHLMNREKIGLLMGGHIASDERTNKGQPSQELGMPI